jgi:hypothetical protein
MNEIEIDQTYLSDDFISKLNSSEDEKVASAVNLVLENYEIELTYEKIVYLTKMLNGIFINEIDAHHFLRQVKYLINKGLYNRLSKKFKNDLLAIGLNEDKIDLIIEIQRGFFDKNVKKNEINEKKKEVIVKDFEVRTEMPVWNSNYKIKEETLNEDLKKQKILIKFTTKHAHSDDNIPLQNFVLEMNKMQLQSFYEEIEKIQENLDKLS